MKTYLLRQAGRALAGFGVLAGLGACATGPGVHAVKVQGAYQPVAVVVNVVPEDGPQVNQWGGIIPDAKPTTPVDDGGLGEIGS